MELSFRQFGANASFVTALARRSVVFARGKGRFDDFYEKLGVVANLSTQQAKHLVTIILY